MYSENNIKDVQNKILEIMKYIDMLCRKENIEYFIMGGTALGAIRHGGFIPWDDDLDIFMTSENYSKFKEVFDRENQDNFIIQEWRSVPEYLEYAKVRMNGTTFIEANFKNRRDLHQGIYVDIMILHKVPENVLIQRIVYIKSKFVTLYGLSQRNWVPKSFPQKLALKVLKMIPSKQICNKFYRHIYKYDSLVENYNYCYWITPAKFKNGLFNRELFAKVVDIEFEDTLLMGPNNIRNYLSKRYGNYMKLPPVEQRIAAIHADIYDVSKDYSLYI